MCRSIGLLEAIKYAYTNDLMNGVSDTAFSPDSTLNRAMLATILYRLEGEPAVKGRNTYADVAADTWYTDAVIWASENGIVTGYGEGKFGPTDNITREQMAVMLYRYAEYKKYDTTVAGMSVKEYADYEAISSGRLRRWLGPTRRASLPAAPLRPSSPAAQPPARKPLPSLCASWRARRQTNK